MKDFPASKIQFCRSWSTLYTRIFKYIANTQCKSNKSIGVTTFWEIKRCSHLNTKSSLEL